jgi:hypothetical protein
MQIRGIHPHYSLRGEEKEMRIARFIAATLAFCVIATLFVAYGNNVGMYGDFDWNAYGDSFFGIFGGAGSFFALLGVIVALGIATLAVLRLAQMNRNGAAAGLALAGFIIAAVISRWVDWSFIEGVWPALVYLLVAAVATFVIGAILGPVPLWRRRTAGSTTTTTTTPN